MHIIFHDFQMIFHIIPIISHSITNFIKSATNLIIYREQISIVAYINSLYHNLQPIKYLKFCKILNKKKLINKNLLAYY